MAFQSRLKDLHHRYFSSPKSDRLIYRVVQRQAATRLVEIGMDNICRSCRLIWQAQFASSGSGIEYTALDPFDSRPPEWPPLKLIETHRQLCRTGAKIKLVPGDTNSAIARVANSLLNSDLILIDLGRELPGQAQLWFYLPRMLHDRSLVFHRAATGSGKFYWKRLSIEKIRMLHAAAIRQAA